MRPKGTIYRSAAANVYGETRISLSTKESNSYKRKRLIGAIFASFSITSLIFFYGPSLILDLQIIESRLKNVEKVQEVLASDSETEKVAEKEEISDNENTNIDENNPITVDNFSLSIPAINAESEVIYNVDPFVRGEYLAALQKGIAHSNTSALPGQGKRIYLFAHSTNSPINFNQYNAIFYQLRLLQEGDEIVSTLNGVEHTYKVKEKKVVAADDTEWLIEKGDNEQLVLQTCDPPGTTLRRLLVVAEKAS